MTGRSRGHGGVFGREAQMMDTNHVTFRYHIYLWCDVLSLQVRILEIIFFYGLVGLAARCIMDLVVFRAGFAQVRAAGPALLTSWPTGSPAVQRSMLLARGRPS
jgi:hypothetical protein